jgi:hypothetical protein
VRGTSDSVRRGAAICLLVLGVLPAHAASAQPRGTVYIEGGVAFSRQEGPSGEVSETYVTAPGGTTAGWLVGGGVFVASRLAIHGEWMTTGEMTATEASRYFTTFEESRRDRIVMVGARFPIPAGSRMAVLPTAGLAITFADTTSRSIFTDPFSPRPPQPPVRHALDRGVGPFFGADVRLGSPRFALVPSFRMIRTGIAGGAYNVVDYVHTDIVSIYPGGYPRWTLRTALAASLQF